MYVYIAEFYDQKTNQWLGFYTDHVFLTETAAAKFFKNNPKEMPGGSYIKCKKVQVLGE